MRTVRIVLFFLIFSLMSNVLAKAQDAEVSNLGNSFARTSAPSHTHEISLGFANNSATIDARYGKNAIALQEIEEFMRALLQGECGTRVIIIDGAASPLGNEEYNKRLALRRAEAVRDLLRQIEGSDRIPIHAISDGEDWGNFTRSILNGYNLPNRDRVLEIVRSELTNDEKEAALRHLDKSGESFRELVKHHMAAARNAAVIRIIEIADMTASLPPLNLSGEIAPLTSPTTFEKTSLPTAPVAPVAAATPAEPAEPIAPAEPKVEAPRVPVVALRTNLLVPALNAGIEVPIGTNWSVGADYYFPWVWPKRDNKNCFELLSWGVEGRYWFGRHRTKADRLQGHSVGVYGYMGYYDFERNYHGHQGEFVNVGVDYTYAMAVGKRKAVHFEFSLGVGYIYSQARKYSVIEANGPLISDKITKTIGFFGPTKANISLVVPIFQRVKPNDKDRR